jgi:hypothetical protein
MNRGNQRRLDGTDGQSADSTYEISRIGYASLLFLWPLALGLPGVVLFLSRGDHWAAAVVFVLMALLAKGTWNVVKYERDTPLMRIEGGSLTWFGDIPKHRFTVDVAEIRSWQIEYFGMRKNPFYEMTLHTHGGRKLQRVFSAAAQEKSDEIYPLLERYLGHRFTPPFQPPVVT